MSTRFHFKEFKIENFRVFRSIEFLGIRRINIISGINGSGKSALIETIFLTLDLNNPSCLIRPFQWRGIPLSGDDLKLLFPEISKKGQVRAKTLGGSYTIDLSFGPPEKTLSTSASVNMDSMARSAFSQLSASNAVGVSISAKKDGQASDVSRWFMSQIGDGINATGIGAANQVHVPGVYLSQFAPVGPQETADRLSKLIKAGKKNKILDYLKMLSPGVKDVAVFQDGAIAQTYVQRDDKYIALALMGGGLRALAEIVTSIMVSSNGVVFIDELDSALHFSVVPQLWKVIAEICDAENVQIFAITHSRETLASAAAGVRSAGREADFQYVRIDYLDPDHRCVSYNLDELEDSIDLKVEVR